YAGIEISGGDRTILSGITASRNGIAGLIINGDRTRVMDCRIGDNGEAGIGLIQAHDAMIVNNWLSNTVNVQIGEGVTDTTWNTTKTAGTNIVNGPFLGGNYWADPKGTGWSQVTPDRGDGFCNAPFVIDSNNADSLPLHSYTPKPTFQADFTVSPVAGTAPLTVKCTDKSIGDPTYLVYDFGDGTNVTGPNPAHTYRFPGVYSITLSIMKYNTTTYSVMSSTATKPNVITVNSVPVVPLVAKFAASPVTGTAPLKVSFTDQSTGSPTFLNYDFGDGINATGPNAAHTYRFPGVYTVTLSIFRYDSNSGLMLSNASVQKGLIVVNGA
ncbi:MAG: PKD domain-containing protein, partial [Methanomicrobiales archaeon]